MVHYNQAVEMACKIERKPPLALAVHHVTFDVIKNTRALAAGDELVIFKAAEAEPQVARPTKKGKEAAEAEPQVARPAKKAKVKGKK
jgi:hypothetical protein